MQCWTRGSWRLAAYTPGHFELAIDCDADDADFVSLAKKHNITSAHFGLLLGLLHRMEGIVFSPFAATTCIVCSAITLSRLRLEEKL